MKVSHSKSNLINNFIKAKEPSFGAITVMTGYMHVYSGINKKKKENSEAKIELINET